MRYIGRIVRALFVLVGVAVIGVVAFALIGSELRLKKRYDTTVETVNAPTDAAAIARGEHLFQSISCSLCHGEDAGGALMGEPDVFGTFAGPNLTSGRGGVAALRTDTDWIRSIRRGVRHDGTSHILMPSEVFTHLSDADLGAILAYLRRLPPVDREVPRTKYGPMGRLLLAAGKMNLLVASKTPVISPPDTAPTQGTLEYGRYLADVCGCHGCHGYGLSGGRVAGPPGLPPASNLTPSGIGSWQEGDFTRLMREGKRPDGSAIDEFMPWRVFRRMSDDDLHSVWLYLRSVPPKPFGNK